MGLDIQIDKRDIPGSVYYDWKRLFGLEERKKNVIADRGWKPLNRNLFCEPEIVNTMMENDKKLDQTVLYKKTTIKNTRYEYDTGFLTTPPSSE